MASVDFNIPIPPSASAFLVEKPFLSEQAQQPLPAPLFAQAGEPSASMDARKRRAQWAPEAAADLSSSAPERKRPHLSEPLQQPLAPQQHQHTRPHNRQQHQHASPCRATHGDCCAAPACSPASAAGLSSRSIFGMPTGSVSDRFELTENVLGAGQFGSVRECTDRTTGERLACKTVKKVQEGSISSSSSSEGAKARAKPTNRAEVQEKELRNEVDLMMRVVGHPNVVQLRGVFEDTEEVHMVLDLCRGGELFEEVLRRQRFEEADAAHVFAEIVKAVAFCHSRGVMHRDLKPENILLAQKLQDGEPVAAVAARGPVVKLADFGLSVAVGPGQAMKGMAGSPFYMAPEVLGAKYTCKADVWSLGVILYILLCGSPPFWGETDNDVFKAVLQGKPDLTSGPWSGVTAEAKNLVKCLLTVDTSHRPTAQKILTHPWMVRHLAPHRTVRRVSANAIPKAMPLPVV